MVVNSVCFTFYSISQYIFLSYLLEWYIGLLVDRVRFMWRLVNIELRKKKEKTERDKRKRERSRRAFIYIYTIAFLKNCLVL